MFKGLAFSLNLEFPQESINSELGEESRFEMETLSGCGCITCYGQPNCCN